MANDPLSSLEKQLNSEATFKSNLLDGLDKTRWPGRIDYVASRLTDGEYPVGLGTSNPKYLSDGYDLEQAAGDYYLTGIAALTGDRSRKTALPDNFRLGDLLVEFAELKKGLEDVDRQDVPPGEILTRLIVRTIKRQADADNAQLARQLRADAETARELVAELTTVPEIAPLVDSALPESTNPTTLTTELASLDLTTELWDHQLESLALWLYHGMNGYVDMATATGKTVLGLAAIAHGVDSGSLHPADQDRLEDIFDGNVPEPRQNRPNDVLIVTTDDLLGVQWARLFQEHCHTPPAFTNVEETGVRLPWGRIDIRSAGSLRDVDPSEYRLAIFDEVHNYSDRAGWGDHLANFVESPCPVLALTGSATDQLDSLVSQVDRPFPPVYRYTHKLALADGVIPDFEWTLTFTDIAESDTLEQFRDTAEQFEQVARYEGGAYRLEEEALANAAPSLTEDVVSATAGEYVSGSALAKGLQDAGDGETAPTESLEALASGLSNRTIHRLNLRSNLDPVIRAADEAASSGRPVLVLTRSYGEAKQIWQALYNQNDERVVRRLRADQTAEKHDEIIRSFDDAETDEKVLIGPGKRIGQGNDIQSVEVGLNIARPGSGVNTTFVQRLGRLLRNAGGKDTVEFYHLVGIPPEDSTIDPDGESFVRTVAEFFGQVLEPDSEGILKPPTVDIEDGVESDIVALEQRGAKCVHQDVQSTIIELAYATAIDEQRDRKRPAATTDWFSAAFGDEAQPSIQGGMGEGRVRRDSGDDGGTKRDESTQESEGEVDTFTNANGNESGDRGKTRDVDERDNTEEETVTEQIEANAVTTPSPLAEHFDAFRSLAIVHKALLSSTGSEIPESDPLRRWIADVRSIISEDGYGEQECGYGKQQATRSPISMENYRKQYGTDDRVTEFETITVSHPSKAVTILLDNSLSALSSWVVPVAPESEVPLPVLVESDSELNRGRRLLEEFPVEPPITVDDGTDPLSGDSQPTDAVDEGERSAEGDPSDRTGLSATPVEDVRGVSASVGDALRSAGYETMADLQRATDTELSMVDGVSEHRVKLIRATVGTR